jgi:hypothetical protein
MDAVLDPPGSDSCDICLRAAATLTLSYPDGRMRLCRRCIPLPLLPVAEPLDADDALADDDRPFVERTAQR